MKKNWSFFLITVFYAFMASSCATKAGPALIVSVTEAGMATNKSKVGKTGTACIQNVLGLVAWGDSSITAAKNQGKITKVSHVDYDTFSIMGALYTKACTIISGT